MTELKIKEEKIENLIYEVRGKQVMLDSDLAKLYQCTNKTKDINKAVKRNLDRFLEDFYFQLTNEEYTFLRFQIGTSKKETRGGRTYLPYVFTEEGVAMLSSVLKTPIASKISVNIMKAFVVMREYISNNLIEQRHINNMVFKHDNEIKLLQDLLSKFEEKTNEIYFDGQIYDAYSKIKDILSEAKNEIIIIDAYADKTVLDLIRNIKTDVILIVKNKTLLTKTDIKNTVVNTTI